MRFGDAGGELAVAVPVAVDVGVEVALAVAVDTGVAVAVDVGVEVAVAVAVDTGVAVTAAVDGGVAVVVGVGVAVGVGADGVDVGVEVSDVASAVLVPPSNWPASLAAVLSTGSQAAATADARTRSPER
jgi:hypothetical protein